MKTRTYLLGVLSGLACVGIGQVAGQLAYRPEDPLGLSLRFDRAALRTLAEQQAAAGSQADPWLSYALGHAIFQREWSREEGWQANPSGHPHAGVTNSCGMCHNLPFRSAGSGGNVVESGPGRNVPHLFGAGLIESIGLEIGRQLMTAHDRNHNGVLEVPEETRGRRAQVEASPGVWIDYGALDDLNGDGRPGLDDLIKVIPVDAQGRRLAADGPRSGSDEPKAAGYRIQVAPFGSSVGDHQLPTLRSFAVGVFHSLFGLRAHDEVIGTETVAGSGKTSSAGAPQPHFPLEMGPSTATLSELTGAELDLLEHYLLNHPPPALAAQSATTTRGRELLRNVGCTSCHTESWQLASHGAESDRRFFDFVVTTDASGRPHGRMRRLESIQRTGTLVENFFSDLRHHDLGDRFREFAYEEGRLVLVQRFRTPPLWGVASTAPYGHDGQSPTLDEVIRRHGGEAQASARAYKNLTTRDRRSLLDFLQTLILYPPDQIRADIDGDGQIEESYRRAGSRGGFERLQPDLLFQIPLPGGSGVDRNGPEQLKASDGTTVLPTTPRNP